MFKSSKDRYKVLKQSFDSANACRKVLVPRLFNSMLQGTSTADYVITGGNDKRIRCWSLSNPASSSYFINTPDDDEARYL